jgi:hypothetical protein
MKSAPETVPTDSIPGSEEELTSDLHAYLLETWSAVFAEFHPDGVPANLGLDDDFFARGGTSVLAMMVLSRIYDELQVELHFRVMLERATIRQLAHELSLVLRPAGSAA